MTSSWRGVRRAGDAMRGCRPRPARADLPRAPTGRRSQQAQHPGPRPPRTARALRVRQTRVSGPDSRPQTVRAYRGLRGGQAERRARRRRVVLRARVHSRRSTRTWILPSTPACHAPSTNVASDQIASPPCVLLHRRQDAVRASASHPYRSCSPMVIMSIGQKRACHSMTRPGSAYRRSPHPAPTERS